jgi:hypothetical protein
MTHPAWFLRSIFFWSIVLAVAASILLACSSTGNSQRQALSLTVSPTSATAPVDGQVQFTATATYNMPPTPVSPVQANWGVTDSSSALTSVVTVSSSGLAQCTSAASGSYTVGAWILEYSTPPSVMCNVATPYGNPCGDSILKTAQLTCQ